MPSATSEALRGCCSCPCARATHARAMSATTTGHFEKKQSFVKCLRALVMNAVYSAAFILGKRTAKWRKDDRCQHRRCGLTARAASGARTTGRAASSTAGISRRPRRSGYVPVGDDPGREGATREVFENRPVGPSGRVSFPGVRVTQGRAGTPDWRSSIYWLTTTSSY